MLIGDSKSLVTVSNRYAPLLLYMTYIVAYWSSGAWHVTLVNLFNPQPFKIRVFVHTTQTIKREISIQLGRLTNIFTYI